MQDGPLNLAQLHPQHCEARTAPPHRHGATRNGDYIVCTCSRVVSFPLGDYVSLFIQGFSVVAVRMWMRSWGPTTPSPSSSASAIISRSSSSVQSARNSDQKAKVKGIKGKVSEQISSGCVCGIESKQMAGLGSARTGHGLTHFVGNHGQVVQRDARRGVRRGKVLHRKQTNKHQESKTERCSDRDAGEDRVDI